MYNVEDSLKAIRTLFNNAKDLQAVIGKYIEEHDAMKKSIEQFQAQAVERTKSELIAKAREVNGVKVITAVLPMEPAAAKDLMFKLRQAVAENMLAVVGTVSHDKPMLNVAISLRSTHSTPDRWYARLPSSSREAVAASHTSPRQAERTRTDCQQQSTR